MIRLPLLLWVLYLSSVTVAVGAPGDLKWAFAAGGPVRSSPALGTNGLVYFASANGRLHAVNAITGKSAWAQQVDAGLSSPAVLGNGRVLIGGAGVKSFDGTTGQQTGWHGWSEVHSSPAISADGSIYYTTWDGALFFSEDIAETIGRTIYGSPSIGPGELVFAPGGGWAGSSSSASGLHAYRGSTRERIWTFNSVNIIQSTPAIGYDGTVFIGGYDKVVYALDPFTGSVIWSLRTGDSISSSPALGPDETLYIGANDGRLYAINRDGTPKWTFLTGDTIHSTPAVAADGTVYFGSYDQNIYAVDAQSGAEKWRFTTSGQVLSSPIISDDGTVFIGSQDGNLYAIEGSSPLAQSAWPAFKGNPLRTGSDERLSAPQIVRTTTNVLTAAGSNGFVDALVQGSRPMIFHWSLNGRDIVRSENSRLVIQNAKFADSGEYTLAASNAFGQATATVRLAVGFRFSVPPRPGGTVTREPAADIYLPGQRVTLRAEADAGREFLGWSGDLSGSSPNQEITVNSHLEIVPRFTTYRGETLWRVPAVGPQVAISEGNVVYAVANETQVIALHAETGLERWRFSPGDPVNFGPVLGPNGDVFIANQSAVWCLESASGSPKWTNRLLPQIVARLSVGPDGTVYLPIYSGSAHKLLALEGRSGSVKWTTAALPSSTGFNGTSPVAGHNGLVYLTTACDWTVRAFDTASGAIRWTSSFSACYGPGTVLGGNGKLYVTAGTNLFALNALTGARLWTNGFTYETGLGPLVSVDETVYLIQPDGESLVIDGNSGQVKKTFSISELQLGSPAALTASGTLVTTSAAKLVSVSSVTGELLWEKPFHRYQSTVINVGPDGTIYLLSYEEYPPVLLALKGMDALAASPWPIPGGSPRNSGSLNELFFPRLTLTRAPTGASIVIRTTPGRTNHLEFKNSITAQWTPLATFPPSAGAEQSLPENAAASQRFYRIRAE